MTTLSSRSRTHLVRLYIVTSYFSICSLAAVTGFFSFRLALNDSTSCCSWSSVNPCAIATSFRQLLSWTGDWGSQIRTVVGKGRQQRSQGCTIVALVRVWRWTLLQLRSLDLVVLRLWWSSSSAYCSLTCNAQREVLCIQPTGRNIIVFIVHGLFIIPVACQLAILYSYMLHACCVNVLLSLSVHRAIELANSLQVSEAVATPQVEHSSDFVSEFSVYWMGKSLFDLREYRRAAHALRLCKSDEAFFLKCYSLYLVGGVYRWCHYSIFDATVHSY